MTAWLRRFPFGIAFVVAIAAVSLLPEPWKARLSTHGTFHVWAHVAVFCLAFFLNTSRIKSRNALIAVTVLLLLFGLVLEWLQSRIYGNLFEYEDLLADATGIVLGLLIRNMRES